jgi:hypothetical protein
MFTVAQVYAQYLGTTGTRWRTTPQYNTLYLRPGLTNIAHSTKIALHTTCAITAREYLLPVSAALANILHVFTRCF